MADSPSTTLKEGPIAASREDEQLAEGFARGDPSALDRMVERHQDRVARLAHRLLGWPADVDDVVQEVFLAALKGRKGFRGQARLSTWLTRITINACRRHRRRRLLRLRWLTDRRAEQSAPLGDRADQSTMDCETFGRIRLAVQSLPPRYREVVVLRYLEGMPNEAVSQVLGVTRNVVDVRLHRARARLKDRLADLMET